MIYEGRLYDPIPVRVEVEAARILAGDPAEETSPEILAEAWDLVRMIFDDNNWELRHVRYE